MQHPILLTEQQPGTLQANARCSFKHTFSEFDSNVNQYGKIFLLQIFLFIFCVKKPIVCK